MNKIFGIGLHRTGTTTLGDCLIQLGFTPQANWNTSANFIPHYHLGEYEEIYKHANCFRSFQDSPWNHGDFYKFLDKKFPNSKFILTKRNENTWYRSFKKHWTPLGETKTNTSRHPLGKIYHKNLFRFEKDCFDNYEAYYKAIYNIRNDEIIDYFKNRKNDFLIIDWEEGDGWEKLCPFLNRPLLKIPLPHHNKTVYMQG